MIRPSRYEVLYVAVFTAASALLGFIKLPAPVASVALDSVPGYFTAGYLGALPGGVVGCLGHLASAATGGFPLGWLHLVIALQMLGCCWLFGVIIRGINRWWALFLAVPVALLANGVVAPLMLGILGLVAMDAARGLVLVLSIVSGVNATLAAILVAAFARRKAQEM